MKLLFLIFFFCLNVPAFAEISTTKPAMAMPSTISTSASISTSSNVPMSSNIRFGVGIAAEYGTIQVKSNVRPIQQTLGNSIETSFHEAGKKLQIVPSFELGATLMKDYYVGLFVSYHQLNARSKSKTPVHRANIFSHEFNFKSYSEAFVKLGYKPEERIMIYVVAGPTIATWSSTTRHMSESGENEEANFKIRKKQVGLGGGCGLEYKIKDKYSLSFEYVSHYYSSASTRGYMIFLNDIKYGNRYMRYGDLQKTVRLSHSAFAIRLSYFF
jgi:opacity protein-like surface antigen